MTFENTLSTGKTEEEWKNDSNQVAHPYWSGWVFAGIAFGIGFLPWTIGVEYSNAFSSSSELVIRTDNKVVRLGSELGGDDLEWLLQAVRGMTL